MMSDQLLEHTFSRQGLGPHTPTAVSKYGSILKLLRTGTLAHRIEVGPANNTRGFRSADGPRPQMCLFGGSAGRPRPQENLRIRVRGYPRPHSSGTHRELAKQSSLRTTVLFILPDLASIQPFNFFNAFFRNLGSLFANRFAKLCNTFSSTCSTFSTAIFKSKTTNCRNTSICHVCYNFLKLFRIIPPIQYTFAQW